MNFEVYIMEKNVEDQLDR